MKEEFDKFIEEYNNSKSQMSGAVQVYGKDTLDWMIKEYGIETLKQRCIEGRLLIVGEELVKYFNEKCFT